MPKRGFLSRLCQCPKWKSRTPEAEKVISTAASLVPNAGIATFSSHCRSQNLLPVFDFGSKSARKDTDVFLYGRQRSLPEMQYLLLA